jgi:hypothetical protein
MRDRDFGKAHHESLSNDHVRAPTQNEDQLARWRIGAIHRSRAHALSLQPDAIVGYNRFSFHPVDRFTIQLFASFQQVDGASLAMTPEELAGFASTVDAFSADQLDRIYHLAKWLDASLGPVVVDAVEDAWRSMAASDDEARVGDENCVEFIQDVMAVDTDIPVAVKYLEILDAAHINLVLPPSSAPSSPPLPPSTPVDSDTIESVNPNSPRWKQAVALDRRKLIAQVLDIWSERVQERREAYENYEDPVMNAVADHQRGQRLAKKFVARWRARVAKIREMETRADAFRFRKDAEYALRNLVLASREKLFLRIRDERTALKALLLWRAKTAQVQEMERHAHSFRNLNAAQNVLGTISRTRSQRQEAETRADAYYERNLVRRVSDKWLAQTHQRQEDGEKAEAAADFFAAKHAMLKIKEKAQEVVTRQNLAQAREHMLAWKYSRRWRVATRKSKQAKYQQAYSIVRRRIQINTSAAALRKWRDKLSEIREMEHTAESFRARKDGEIARCTAHEAIIVMYTKTEAMQEAAGMAEDFAKRNLVNRLHIFGSSWLEPTRQITENQKIADEYRATRLASYAVGKLRVWKNAAFRARRLEADADSLRESNERKRAIGFLGKWREAAAGHQQGAVENAMVPTTPAARRSQLLASTTPAYTPAAGLFGSSGRLDEEEEEDEDQPQ